MLDTMNPQTQIAAILKTGLSQTQVADLISVSQAHVSRIEKGKARNLALRTALSIDKLWRKVCRGGK